MQTKRDTTLRCFFMSDMSDITCFGSNACFWVSSARRYELARRPLRGMSGRTARSAVYARKVPHDSCPPSACHVANARAATDTRDNMIRKKVRVRILLLLLTFYRLRRKSQKARQRIFSIRKLPLLP